jgi:hypothetical protein
MYQPFVETIKKTCQPVILPACQPSVILFVFEALSEQGLTQVTHMYMFKMYQPLALWKKFKKPASLSSCHQQECTDNQGTSPFPLSWQYTIQKNELCQCIE